MNEPIPAEDATAKAGITEESITAARAALVEKTGDPRAYVAVYCGLFGYGDVTFSASANSHTRTSSKSIKDVVSQIPTPPPATERAKELREKAAALLAEAEQLENTK